MTLLTINLFKVTQQGTSKAAQVLREKTPILSIYNIHELERLIYEVPYLSRNKASNRSFEGKET